MSTRRHPMCRRCGWAMGGLDSWNGTACKCGHMAAPFPDFDALDAEEWRLHLEAGIATALANSGGNWLAAPVPRPTL